MALVPTGLIYYKIGLLATLERVLDKLALPVRILLAKVERVLAVLVPSVAKSLQNPMPVRGFTDIVEFP